MSHILILGFIIHLFSRHMEMKHIKEALETLKEEGVEVINYNDFIRRFPKVSFWFMIKMYGIILQIGSIVSMLFQMLS